MAFAILSIVLLYGRPDRVPLSIREMVALFMPVCSDNSFCVFVCKIDLKYIDESFLIVNAVGIY